MNAAAAAPLVEELPLHEEIAGNIRSLMGRYKVSQERLGAFLGMSQPTFSKRMKGITDWSYVELLKIARFFNVGMDEVVSSTRWFAESPVLDIVPSPGQQELPFPVERSLRAVAGPSMLELALFG